MGQRKDTIHSKVASPWSPSLLGSSDSSELSSSLPFTIVGFMIRFGHAVAKKEGHIEIELYLEELYGRLPSPPD